MARTELKNLNPDDCFQLGRGIWNNRNMLFKVIRHGDTGIQSEIVKPPSLSGHTKHHKDTTILVYEVDCE